MNSLPDMQPLLRLVVDEVIKQFVDCEDDLDEPFTLVNATIRDSGCFTGVAATDRQVTYLPYF